MRIKVFGVAVLFFFGALVLGLFYTQTFKHALYKELSEKNRIRVLPLPAARGKIYDRKGALLVSNRISFDVQVVFQEIKDVRMLVDKLSDLLGMDKKALSKKIDEARKVPFAPLKIARDIEKNKAIQIEETKPNLPGVIVTARPLRNYLYGAQFSHITGYIGKITESKLEKYKTYGYHIQDLVGKDGIEKKYNEYLRGIDGGLQIEVDSKGRQLGLLAVKEPHPGKNLYLNIDRELQEFCDSLLSEKNGAILAMSPSTGSIFALVSHPGFDPNLFVSPENFDKISKLLNDFTTFPMMDRAISCAYPPGSIFKMVVASAALDSEDFNAKKTFFCDGKVRVGNRIFNCWNEKGHTAQNVRMAIKNSCNVFFYQLALSIGADKISEYACKFGLGKPTGIDLPWEKNGLVPTPAWKKKKFNTPWFRGETANYAIGQGYLLVTPIQITCFVSAIANGGKLVKPFVVDRIENIALHRGEGKTIGVKEETLRIIKESMRDVVNAPHGTGIYAKSKSIVISGKTGTAQNPKGVTHAWFVGFAPFENPEIVVTVFIEHGGKGGLEPARFARKIIKKARELELF